MFLNKNSLAVLLVMCSFVFSACVHRGGNPGDAFLDYNSDYQNKLKGVYIVIKNGKEEFEFVGYSEAEKNTFLKAKVKMEQKKLLVTKSQKETLGDLNMKEVPVTIKGHGSGVLIKEFQGSVKKMRHK